MDNWGESRQRRCGIAWSLAGLVPVGLYSKVYAGPLAEWVNNSLGGVFYVLFWCLVIFGCLPKARPRGIALAVVAVTGGLEFLQLWHPPFLEWLRSYGLGQILLGTTFAWSDFPYYVIGGGLGWWWMQALRH